MDFLVVPGLLLLVSILVLIFAFDQFGKFGFTSKWKNSKEGKSYMQVVQINGQVPFDVTLGADEPQVFVVVQNTFFL